MMSDDTEGQDHPSHWVEDLCHRHQASLNKIACRFAGPGRPAEDIMQEIWVRVVELALTNPPRQPSLAWLVKVATLVAHEQFRRRRDAEVPAAFRIEEQARAAQSGEPLPAWVASELSREIDALPPRQRKAVQMRYHEGLTLEEIAHALDVALGTVKATLNRARGRLRSRLLPMGEMWLRDDI
jgi:RNA polymerase sigma-70 factor (ECF subfamily)